MAQGCSTEYFLKNILEYNNMAALRVYNQFTITKPSLINC